jgi:hypothetical protein
MANPTTNFGWVMPTATDLVTDLPADFAVFGQGVDTSMAYLLGGTTGQILSKTSGTNMAFTWINNDQGDITGVTAGTGISGGGTSGTVTVSIDTAVTADLTTAQTLTNKTLTAPIISSISNTGTLTLPTATDTLVGRATTDTLTNKTIAATSNTLTGVINNTLTTTTGDIIYASSANTPARLGIGSTSQVLTVTGGVPVWATASGGGTWAAWSPTYSGLTIGNGTVIARYAQTGKVIEVFYSLKFGTTTSISGTIDISVPVAAAQQTVQGFGLVLDDSGVGSTLGQASLEAGNFRLSAVNSSATYATLSGLSSSVPFSWGNLDSLRFNATYEAS